MDELLERLWRKVMAESPGIAWWLHGPPHWARVERNGVYLAQAAGLDDLIVRLFALLHDCMRENESRDAYHGARAAKYAETIRGELPLADEQFELLHYACRYHTEETFAESPIVGICWDADRLDLGRVGMVPDANFLNSVEAKRIAAVGNYSVLEGLRVRTPPRRPRRGRF